jgi:hypothetical protein
LGWFGMRILNVDFIAVRVHTSSPIFRSAISFDLLALGWGWIGRKSNSGLFVIHVKRQHVDLVRIHRVSAGTARLRVWRRT